MDVSTQAVKKGASQTVIGLIFGCYAACNLIGSLILGKYVSLWHCVLSVHWDLLPRCAVIYSLFAVVSDRPNWCEVHARCRTFCVVRLHHSVWVSVGPVCYVNHDDGCRDTLRTVVTHIIK